MTLERLFELKVMFFGLTNSPVMFQTMINKIIQNLINTRVVRSFINNVIVEIEEEKRYNKIVEEVLKRLVENNLHVKLEKCKWKVREVGFLEVVIELKGIKIKKEKAKGILDQLTLKERLLASIFYLHTL